MEYAMRMHIPYTALGLALVAAAPVAANAQTVITREINEQPVQTIIAQQPVETMRTVETTTRTVRPAGSHRQVVTTRRTIVNQPVAVAPAVIARSAPTYPQPLYDQVVAPAPLAISPGYSRPLYDWVPPQPPPVTGPTIISNDTFVPEPAASTAPFYRYLYERDRILVVDPYTNLTVQTLPR
jgi:hypothetical protein